MIIITIIIIMIRIAYICNSPNDVLSANKQTHTANLNIHHRRIIMIQFICIM